MLNVKFEANWQMIKQNKQRKIHDNKKRENDRRIPNQYMVGDKVLYQFFRNPSLEKTPTQVLI